MSLDMEMDIHDTAAYKRATEAGREPFCEDPTHDADCDCGATPDADYEAHVEDRL